MDEIKSVKVDNWGVFFLQKLQNFFNKTDYCDLTLQFHDNSQLKVHRLVLSACTDYFNVLEQTCDVIDEALIMPNELQADVVVPIVNFMYTGILEFEMKMYGKLLRTAKEMNMTVLLKLLEAHRRTMEIRNRVGKAPSPKSFRRKTILNTTTQAQNATQRRILTTADTTSQQHQFGQPSNIAVNARQQMPYRQQIGASTLTRTATVGTTTISRANVKQDALSSVRQQQVQSSPFEQLRKGYNNNKRPASSTPIAPVTKRPNIEEVKEFTEQQRMRKQIAAEYGEDQEYDGMFDDDIHNVDDDDDAPITTAASTSGSAGTSSQQQEEDLQGAIITFRHDQTDKPPTLVVKDSSNSKMNHAKIVQEILRRYPHLVKGNKNIKLKIMPSGSSGQLHKVILKKESALPEVPKQLESNNTTEQHALLKPSNTLPQASAPQVQKNVLQTSTQMLRTNRANAPASTSSTAAAADNNVTPVVASSLAADVSQKRRIDSKTMHALIALGAENTTGPWLCLRCGVNGRPISIPSYRGFRRHLINTHKEIIDAALCEHCGWRSSSARELHFHMQSEHKIKSTEYVFPECQLCNTLFQQSLDLFQHLEASHPNEKTQQCIYCNQCFDKELDIYMHMHNAHKLQLIEDGIFDGVEDEVPTEEEENDETKIKILSDISLPNASTLLKLKNPDLHEMNSEGEALEYTQLETAHETKFVTADGNEMMLTEEQRKEILSQLSQDQKGGTVVMMMDGENIYETSGESVNQSATSAAGNEELETQDSVEDKAETQNTNVEESKETADYMEWAENVVYSQDARENDALASEDMETEQKEEEEIKKSDISKKLQELTGDWSEDENDNDDNDDDEDLLTINKGNQEKAKNIEETTEIKDAEAVTEAKDDSVGEDDIEQAMRSLHKDESTVSEDDKATADFEEKEKENEAELAQTAEIKETDVSAAAAETVEPKASEKDASPLNANEANTDSKATEAPTDEEDTAKSAISSTAEEQVDPLIDAATEETGKLQTESEVPVKAEKADTSAEIDDNDDDKEFIAEPSVSAIQSKEKLINKKVAPKTKTASTKAD